MTQKEFLAKINLTAEEFSDLLSKFSDFEKSLQPAQRDAVRRSLPPMAKALKSLGPDVTHDELLKIAEKITGKKRVQDDGAGTFGTNIWAVDSGKRKKK